MNKKFLIALVILIAFGAYSLKVILFLYCVKLERIEFEVGDMEIDDFAYWLSDIDKDEVKESKFDLIILDYSADGSESEEFSSKEVKYMKSSGDQEKLLLSYISIGEAEDYRFYYDDSWEEGEPDWLDEENPDWEGNYKVKYWEEEWQEIIYEYLDRIMDAKFDGIYMDIIDAYEYYEDDEPDAEQLMMDFVGDISDYVKDEEGDDFLVFVQNADDLLSDSEYLDYIDGIGREDLFYDDAEKTDEEWRDEGIDNLNEALGEDKVVLIIDYPISEKYDFYKNCVDNGYLGYAAEKDLDRLNNYFLYPAT